MLIIGRGGERLAAAADALNAATGAAKVRWLRADLSEPAQVALVASEITATSRDVDVLVNNAGGNFAPFPADSLDGVRDGWLSNVTGNVLPAALLTHALLPAIRRPGGRIITVTSIAAFRGPDTYGGAKAALHPWSAALALRLAPEGVTVNVIAPGYVAGTDFYGERMSPQFDADRSRQSPMDRGGTVEEIAATVGHLAGPGAGYLTGQIIQVNGGALLGRG